MLRKRTGGNRMRKWIVVLTIAVLALTGCATIMHGSRQNINFFSTPEGATVKIDGVNVGLTPVAKELSRKSEHKVEILLEGYEPFEMMIEQRVSGWLFGNILFGGIPGLIIDLATGGLFNLTPEQVKAELSEAQLAHLYKENTLYVAVTLNPDPEWEKIGQLTPTILQ